MLAFLGPIGLLIKIAMSVLGGGGIAGIVQTVTKHLDNLNDNATKRFEAGVGAEKEVKIAELHANADAWHDRVDLLKGLKVTQFLIVAALIGPLWHSGLVYFDSCTWIPWPSWPADQWLPSLISPHVLGSWHVPSPPKPYDSYEWLLISSLLGVQTTTATVMGVVRYLKT